MQLILRGPEDETREVELTGARVHVGRAHDNTIVLSENTVSRHHCSMFRDDQGRAILEDLESRYGTYLDGDAVEGPTPVTPGQKIKVGEWTIKVVDDQATASTDTTLEAVSSEEEEEETEQLDSQGPTRKTRLLDDIEPAGQTSSSGYLALLLTLAAMGALLLAYVVVSSTGG